MRTSRLLLSVSVFSVALLSTPSFVRLNARSINKFGRNAGVDTVTLCITSEQNPMGRGCCSWHGGECGCQGGRDLCCDGTLSPTCTCHR